MWYWGTAAPTPKLACFVRYLKIINNFLLIIFASYSKLPKELKNGIGILVGQAVLSYGSKQSKCCLGQLFKNRLAYLNSVYHVMSLTCYIQTRELCRIYKVDVDRIVSFRIGVNRNFTGKKNLQICCRLIETFFVVAWFVLFHFFIHFIFIGIKEIIFYTKPVA